MSLYELLLFLHISAAIVWIGSGTLLNVLAYRYDRKSDIGGLQRIAADASELAKVLFIPASMATLLLGILLTIDGPWSLSFLWIVLGLVGIAATIATGLLIITPRSEEIDRLLSTEGMTPLAATKINQLLTLGRIDLVVLYMVVADMAIKPTGDDVGVLVAMALIVIAAVVFFTARARALSEPQASAAPSPAGTSQ
jgi:Predicted integral membrane protein (DUF2269)